MHDLLKRALLSFVLIASISQIRAQENDMSDRKIRFGLMATPNIGWMQPRIDEFDKSGAGTRMGFGYGLMMDLRIGESANYLFSSGASLTSFGGSLSEAWQEEFTLQGTDTSSIFYGKNDRTYRYQYLTIPVLLKMRTDEIGYMTYFGAVGFDLGFRTRAFANDDYTWPNGVGPLDEDDINISSLTNPIRAALNITVGGEFNISGHTNAYVGIGWHNGFINAFSKSDNKALIPDDSGNPAFDDNGFAITGPSRKATANYVSLDLGVFF